MLGVTFATFFLALLLYTLIKKNLDGDTDKSNKVADDQGDKTENLT